MRTFLISLILFTQICFSACLANTGDVHVSEMRNVLNGFSGKQFDDLAYAITKGIDEKEIIPDPVPPNRVQGLPAEFKRAFGKLPSANHRILGHGWALGAPIPEDTLQYLAKEYPGKLDEIRKINSIWSENMVRVTEELTGLPNTKAKAFASLLHNIHLLGDVEPGNKITELVLPPEDIKKNIVKDLRVLADKSPAAVNQIEEQLQKVIRESHISKQVNISKLIVRGECTTVAEAEKLISQQCARDLLETLYHANVGPLIHETCPSLSLEFSEQALQRAARRVIDKIPNLAEKGILTEQSIAKNSFGRGTQLAEKAFQSCARGTAIASAQDVVVTAAAVTESGTIIVPSLVTGVGEAGAAFFVDAGIAGYQYYTGGVSKGEFVSKLEDAAIKGVSVGGLSAVTVALGATPGGWVVIGVGVGTYFVTDIALSYYHEWQDSQVLTDDDMALFGFPKHSQLDPAPGASPLDNFFNDEKK